MQTWLASRSKLVSICNIEMSVKAGVLVNIPSVAASCVFSMNPAVLWPSLGPISLSP